MPATRDFRPDRPALRSGLDAIHHPGEISGTASKKRRLRINQLQWFGRAVAKHRHHGGKPDKTMMAQGGG